MKSLFFVLVLALAFSSLSNAQQLRNFQVPQSPSDEKLEEMAQHNEKLSLEERKLGPVFRSGNLKPFAEYQKTGYVVFSDDDFGGVASKMKTDIAANLPADVQLIVYTQSADKGYQKQVLNTYAKYISPSRLHVLQIPDSGSNDFWSRDNLPLPVFASGNFSLVDAQYYYNFEPDSYLSQIFGVSLDAHKYFYEGGNFMANSRGDCIMVNRKKSYIGGTSDTAKIPDDIFKSKYGCSTITRLKHLKGIGHADEVVKFMSDDVVITDTPEYKTILEQKGFTVLMVPEADLNYETYINSLIVNDTVFVPVFGEKNDQAVLDLYKGLGFKTVAINTRRLATQGQGGVHCITMNYPPAPLKNVAAALNLL